MKSVKPPNTRNGACAFFRGWEEANEGSDTVAVMRVSFPTLPHLQMIHLTAHRVHKEQNVRELDTGEVGGSFR